MGAVIDLFIHIVHDIFYIMAGQWLFGSGFRSKADRAKIPLSKRLALGSACFLLALTIGCALTLVLMDLGVKTF